MKYEDPVEIGQMFLKDLDDYIKRNWKTLLCSDLHRIYIGFFHELKRWRGNAHDFSGLSELLVFRFVLHQLGSGFKPFPENPTERQLDTALFHFKTDAKAKVSVANSPRLVELGGIQPDIVFFTDGNIHSVIQIKVYITDGLNEVKREFETLERIQVLYPGSRALFLVYSRLGSGVRATVRPALEDLSTKHDWFGYLELAENDELLARELDKALGLDGFDTS